MPRKRYVDQVKLLVDVLPTVVAEPDFALKGGTAINLFCRNLPRLSVDIDLALLPVQPRKEALAGIDAAMDRIVARGKKSMRSRCPAALMLTVLFSDEVPQP